MSMWSHLFGKAAVTGPKATASASSASSAAAAGAVGASTTTASTAAGAAAGAGAAAAGAAASTSLFATVAGPLALGAVLAGSTLAGGVYLYHQVQEQSTPQKINAADDDAVAKLAASIPTPTQFDEKTTTYAADATTDVLIDAPDVDPSEIVKIIKHGDHWHVFTKDGREIITYKDPTRARSARDLRDTHSVVSAGELKRVGSEVVKILKHGNHYHVYTADGREFITYTDPSGLYPNIPIGTYTGSHASHHADAGASAEGQADDQALTQADAEAPDMPGLNIIHVVSLNRLAKMDITKILKHADHYHCYTRDGREVITYDDPQYVFPQIEIGTYVGNHEDGGASNASDDASNPFGGEAASSDTESKIVRILKHGDHWHCYDAAGNEFIYRGNAPAAFPNASRGIYTGPEHDSAGNPLPSGSSSTDTTTTDSSSPIPLPLPSEPSESSHGHEGLMRVLTLDELKSKAIVRILKHGDHWHVYDKDNKEYVVHEDPSAFFPDAEKGDYEQAIDPRIQLEGDEIFSYDDVKAEKKVDLSKLSELPYEDLQWMKAFDKESQTFYVWHLLGGAHTHAHSISDIARLMKQNEKAGHKYNYTARELVATLKYYIEHPNEQPKDDAFVADYNGQKPSFYKEKHAVSVIKDKEYGQVHYIVRFDNGSEELMSSSQFKALENSGRIHVDDYSNINVKDDKSLGKILQEVRNSLGVTEEEFDDAWLHAGWTYAAKHSCTFNDDGTVTVYGKTYDFLKPLLESKKQKAQAKAAEKEKNAQEETQAEHTNKTKEADKTTPTQLKSEEAGADVQQPKEEHKTDAKRENANARAKASEASSAPAASAAAPTQAKNA